ncbi:MAG: hypothetical protein QOD03_253 [Verrucomicrobiota bacterium]|jgi:hypothetical protein
MCSIVKSFSRRKPQLLIFSVLLTLASCGAVIESARAALTVSIGQNFTGSDNSQTLITPADSDGAIGPQHFVEFINGTFAVYSKTNGQRKLRISDIKFWSNAGVTLPASDGISDPRVIYDSASQRWFASQVDFDASAGDPSLNSDYFLLAVSDTSDPLGSWHGFSFLADPDAGNFADFPTLGVDGAAVYIAGDMYFGESNPLGSVLVSIPKSDLLAITPTIAHRSFFGTLDYAERGNVLQPVSCVDGSSSGNVLAAGDINSDSQIIGSIVLNAGNTNATLAAASPIPVTPYDAPFPFDVTQPDATTTLSANDARISSRAYTVGGVIYATHSIQVNGRAAIRWYRVNATNYALIESGTITDASLDLFYPSITANASGVVVIGCNGSGLTTLVSSFAYVGETVNGITTFDNRMLLAAGGSVYHDIYEQVEFSDESRWGDYSATTPDPTDFSRFWTIQMLPLADGETWTMQITELRVSQLPQLAIAPAGTNVNILWPLSAASFQLQSSTNLSNTNSWLLVTQTRATNGSQLSVTLPASAQQQFFRLKN